MELKFDVNVIENYHSKSQIARRMTENWVEKNMYCPRCGSPHLKQFENNRPVADFFCPICNNQYELKSKNGSLGPKIDDGSYETMLERITGNQNPDFFFMSYSRNDLDVKDLILIPKHFFVPDIIEKRWRCSFLLHRCMHRCCCPGYTWQMLPDPPPYRCGTLPQIGVFRGLLLPFPIQQSFLQCWHCVPAFLP